MGNKALKIFYTVFMSLILGSLIVFMVIHIKSGLDTQYGKLILGGYILLLLWAAARIYSLVRDLLKK